jgi:hypothetical protein
LEKGENMFSMSKKKRGKIISLVQGMQIDHRFMDAVKIMIASLVIGISAQCKIPLYFTPVPLIITHVSVMFVGAFLGSRRGVLAVLCYLLQGCMGLPVWAGGVATGFSYLIGPTGGYLMGYFIHAFLIGKFLEKSSQVTGCHPYFNLFTNDNWKSMACSIRRNQSLFCARILSFCFAGNCQGNPCSYDSPRL